MSWVKCKNDTEKLVAIKDYCNKQIESNKYSIEFLKEDRNNPFDYAEEIRELEVRNHRFEKIIKIIDADEFTSVMVD